MPHQLPAEALRRAKQAFRRHPEWSRPHLWAGYVLTGRALPVTERIPPGWWIAGALAALGAAGLLLQRRRA